MTNGASGEKDPAPEEGPPEAAVRDRRGRRRFAAKLALIGVWFALLFGARVLETSTQGSRASLDDAWKIGFAQRWQQGEVAGRDFAFTYGPASQAIAAVGAGLHSGESLLAARPMIDLVFVALNLLVLAAVLLALPELGVGWTAIVLVGLEVPRVAEHYASLRVLAILALSLVFAKAVGSSTRARRRLLALLAGGLAVLAQLLSADNLVYGVAALAGGAVVVVAHRWWRTRRTEDAPDLRGPLEAVAIALGVLAAGNLVIALVTTASGRPFGTYHLEVFEISAGYALTMGLPWSHSDLRSVGLVLSAALAGVWLVSRREQLADRNLETLLVLGVPAALTLRGALTRSDPGHLLLALTPATIVMLIVGGLVSGSGRRRPNRLDLVLAVAVLGWLVSLPLGDWDGPRRVVATAGKAPEVARHLSRLRHSTLTRATAVPGALRRLERVARAEGHLGPLAVVPYQNDLAVALDRKLAGSILQAYSAHLIPTQERYLEGLWRARREVLLVLESPRQPPLDLVTFPTRLPVIVRGLIERYRPIAPDAAPGFLWLVPREEIELLGDEPIGVGEARREDGALVVGLEAEGGCRLLELELLVRYGPRLALGRAGPLELEVELAGGRPVTTRLVALERRRPFPVLVPLIPQHRFAEMWSPGLDEGPRPRSVEIRVLYDAGLDVAPSELSVESATCRVR